MLRTDDPPAAGLRERKKARTRAAIQEHALRLFREQGYDETTVEQIADAAEVSPSTFFRYFPTKEDVVMYDALDPVLIAAFRAQPPELSPIGAMRRAFHAVWDALPPEQLAAQHDRGQLVFSIPALRGAYMDDMIRTAREMAAILAERVGRDPGDFAVRTFTGALIGALLAAMLPAMEKSSASAADYGELIDAALAHLEAGLPL